MALYPVLCHCVYRCSYRRSPTISRTDWMRVSQILRLVDNEINKLDRLARLKPNPPKSSSTKRKKREPRFEGFDETRVLTPARHTPMYGRTVLRPSVDPNARPNGRPALGLRNSQAPPSYLKLLPTTSSFGEEALVGWAGSRSSIPSTEREKFGRESAPASAPRESVHHAQQLPDSRLPNKPVKYPTADIHTGHQDPSLPSECIACAPSDKEIAARRPVTDAETKARQSYQISGQIQTGSSGLVENSAMVAARSARLAHSPGETGPNRVDRIRSMSSSTASAGLLYLAHGSRKAASIVHTNRSSSSHLTMRRSMTARAHRPSEHDVMARTRQHVKLQLQQRRVKGQQSALLATTALDALTATASMASSLAPLRSPRSGTAPKVIWRPNAYSNQQRPFTNRRVIGDGPQVVQRIVPPRASSIVVAINAVTAGIAQTDRPSGSGKSSSDSIERNVALPHQEYHEPYGIDQAGWTRRAPGAVGWGQRRPLVPACPRTQKPNQRGMNNSTSAASVRPHGAASPSTSVSSLLPSMHSQHYPHYLRQTVVSVKQHTICDAGKDDIAQIVSRLPNFSEYDGTQSTGGIVWSPRAPVRSSPRPARANYMYSSA